MRTALIVALTARCVLAAAHPRATVTTRSDFSVPAHAVIDVDSAAGSVELTTGPAGAVAVEAERRADTEERARRLDVVTRLEGDTLHVRFKRGPSPGDESVSFRIRAPADARLEIVTGGGSVVAPDFSGGIHVETGGGSIDVDDARGRVRLRSGGGSITVARIDGNVELDTGGGSIRVAGRLRGKNHVETGGGSIRVAIPADDALQVDASSGAGSARNDFNLPSQGHFVGGAFHGHIGDGSAGSLELRTGAGAISLERS